MKRNKLIIVVSMLLALTITACSTTPKATTEQEPIVIGSVNDLSGTASVLGNAVDRGAKLAVEKINADGGVLGRQLKLISYDNRNDPQETINAYTRLVDQDKAVAVISPPNSTMGLSLVSISTEKKVPVLGLLSDPRCTVDEKTGKAHPYMFLVAQPNAAQQAAIMAEYVLKELGFTKAAFFYAQSNAYSVVSVGSFKDYFTARGGTISAEETFTDGDQDFKTQLTNIKNSDAEFLYVPNTTVNLVLMVEQAAQIGLDIPYVGAMDMSPPFLTLLSDPKIVKHAYYENSIWEKDPNLADVYAAYEQKFGEPPTTKSFQGYDTVYVIKAAIEKAGKADPQAIRDQLENGFTEDGFDLLVTKNYKMDAATHKPLGMTMIIVEIRDGEMINRGVYGAELGQ